jgi:hypothetical protein
MNRSSWLVAVLVAAGMLAGCRDISGPNWTHPGTTEEQRAWAERYNPYPETNIGPDVVGGRPREFQNQISEPARSRWSLFPSRQPTVIPEPRP